MNKLILRSLPLCVFIGLSIFLWKGLYSNPRDIPSSFIGKKIPKFNLPTINSTSNVLKDNDFIGHISLLNVWASWCMACKEEQAFLLNLAGNGIKIYGLNYKDNPSEALNWLQTWGNPYQIIGVDKSGVFALDLGIYGSPETFLIDKRGIIRFRYAGILTQEIWQKKFLPIILELS